MTQTKDMDPFLLEMLVCPVTRSPLKQEGEFLVGEHGGLKYPITDNIPRLLADQAVLPDGYDDLDAFKADYPVIEPEEEEVAEAEDADADEEADDEEE